MEFVYKDQTGTVLNGVNDLIEKYKSKSDSAALSISQEDIVLISYGDSITVPSKEPLASFQKFYEDYLGDCFSIVHILPFYPYSSDDGFSVTDYKMVNPELGSWSDIAELSKVTKLMFDAVVNHISARSNWLARFLAGDEEYDEYFVREEGSFDSSQVVRPRTSPLYHDFEKSNGSMVSLWTTFSKDQVDLNYANPRVFLAIVDLLLFYCSKGARFLRLDAIGFLWKKSATTCIHLDETHAVIQVWRKLLDSVYPGTMIITETNVPHAENVSYFGNGYNEAHMVYNFTLPPLLAYSLLIEDCRIFEKWVSGLILPSSEVCFFNFLASHDGVGLRPLDGILDQGQINVIIESAEVNGGLVSYKSNPDGTESPYEINCNYMNLLMGNSADHELGIKRFVLAHAVLLSMPGIPAIYIHSILGSENDLEGVKRTGQNRSINREKLNISTVTEQLQDPRHARSKIYKEISHLIKVRKSVKAFHPNVAFSVHEGKGNLLVIQRGNSEDKVLCIFNFSIENRTYELKREGKDLIQGINVKNTIEIPALSFKWIQTTSSFHIR